MIRNPERVSVYPYFGGKSRFIDEILSFVPDDTTDWYELFAGSAAVSLNMQPQTKMTKYLNDLDYGIYNILDLLSKPETAKELIDSLCELEYSRSIYRVAEVARDYNYNGLSRIDRATLDFVLLTQSFSAMRKGYSNKDTTDSYRKRIKNNLPKVAERLQSFSITNQDALDIINEVNDKEKAFLYMDVPYRLELRNGEVYVYEMDTEAQFKMLAAIVNAKSRVLICGYRDPIDDLYDRYLSSSDQQWHLYKIKEVAKSCQSGAIKDIASEYVWVNYEIPETAKFVEKVY